MADPLSCGSGPSHSRRPVRDLWLLHRMVGDLYRVLCVAILLVYVHQRWQRRFQRGAVRDARLWGHYQLLPAGYTEWVQGARIR